MVKLAHTRRTKEWQYWPSKKHRNDFFERIRSANLEKYPEERTMADARVIVTYQRLSEMLGKAGPAAIIEAVKAPAPEGFEAAGPPATDEETAQVMAELAKAQEILKAEERIPGVLVSPDDRLTSVLQSLLAEKSLAIDKVALGESGGLEA